jgi:ATP-binding cassette subfamily F protein uup
MLLVNAQDLTKTFGADPLFQGISLSINEGDRIGLIGPNGSGKTTLLEILAGRGQTDSGEVALRKGLRLGYVKQDAVYAPGQTVRSVIRRALSTVALPERERDSREAETLGRAGFDDFEADVSALSGGWRKRLAIVEALVQDPAVLLLDEPTNHLDLAGISWLEGLLVNAPFACIVVSHDRYFLENVATSMAEINRAYPGGMLRVAGSYSVFLEKKAEFLHAQAKHQESLENRVRTELEWLRRGPKARATKAKARIKKAQEMIGDLADLRSRSRTASTDIDFTATDRKTKRLIHLEDVACGFGERMLYDELSFTLTAGVRVGLVGSNGSGKTTLLRLLNGELAPTAGSIERADALRIVYFEQGRHLDPDLTLRRALAPDADSVIYRDRVIHVNSWAARFLFTAEQLGQPVGRLSGGERARVLIARLMLEPADVLLLDEPANDLDIPTLEILEESLLEFTGALVLVTHDRYMLDRVSTVVLGLDGRGGAERFADYSQWEAWLAESRAAREKPAPSPAAAPAAERPASRRLSYMEAREYDSLEARIAAAEQTLAARRAELQDPAVVCDGRRLQALSLEIEQAEQDVDTLYARWAELEERMA